MTDGNASEDAAADGSAAGQSILFARLGTGLTLTAADFTII